MTIISCTGQTVPQNLKVDEVHSYISSGGHCTRSEPISRQHASQKLTPSESLAYVEWRKKRADPPPFRLEFEAQQTPTERLPHIQLVINRDTFCLPLRITYRPMKCYSRAARGLTRSVDWHSTLLFLVEFQRPTLFWSTVFLVNGTPI